MWDGVFRRAADEDLPTDKHAAQASVSENSLACAACLYANSCRSPYLSVTNHRFNGFVPARRVAGAARDRIGARPRECRIRRARDRDRRTFRTRCPSAARCSRRGRRRERRSDERFLDLTDATVERLRSPVNSKHRRIEAAVSVPPISLLKNVGWTPRPSEFQREITDEASVLRVFQQAAIQLLPEKIARQERRHPPFIRLPRLRAGPQFIGLRNIADLVEQFLDLPRHPVLRLLQQGRRRQ